MIKTIDDKNHVKILRKEDIEIDSIVIKKSDIQPVITRQEKIVRAEPEKTEKPKKKKTSKKQKST